MWQALIAPITGVFNNVIKRFVKDKDLAMQIEAALTQEMLRVGKQELEGRIKIILAEANGKSWLQRNWRPVLMMSIVAIVVNNYIILPYLHLFGLPATELDLPNKLFTLMEIGVGGYVVGRSAEKVMEVYKRDK